MLLAADILTSISGLAGKKVKRDKDISLAAGWTHICISFRLKTFQTLFPLPIISKLVDPRCLTAASNRLRKNFSWLTCFHLRGSSLFCWRIFLGLESHDKQWQLNVECNLEDIVVVIINVYRRNIKQTLKTWSRALRNIWWKTKHLFKLCLDQLNCCSLRI